MAPIHCRGSIGEQVMECYKQTLLPNMNMNIQIHVIIINLLYLYSSFLGTQSALHGRGESPPPPVCSIHLDDATAAILRQNAHHTPATGGEETEWWTQSVYGDD